MAEISLGKKTIQESPKVIVVTFAGEADFHNGRRVESFVDELLQNDKPKHLLLDLSGLTFAGSAFFGSLLFWREAMTNQGGDLVLFGLRPEVASTLRIATLDRVLKIAPDQAAALAALPR